jgi:high-affinity Fe2+/Pb2+ permease
VVRNKTDASSLQMSITLFDHSKHIIFVVNVDFVFRESKFSEKYIFYNVLTMKSTYLHYFMAAVSFFIFLILILSTWVLCDKVHIM